MPSLPKALQFLLSVSGALLLSATTNALPLQVSREVNSSGRLEANGLESNRSVSLAEPPMLAQAGTGARKRFGQKKGAKGNGAHGTGGLQPLGNGIVYDSTQNVYWLADGNLAADAQVREMLGATKLKINSDGSMDYTTALEWVQTRLARLAQPAPAARWETFTKSDWGGLSRTAWCPTSRPR